MLFVIVGLLIDKLVVHPHAFSRGEQSFGAGISPLQMVCVLTRRRVVKVTCCTVNTPSVLSRESQRVLYSKLQPTWDPGVLPAIPRKVSSVMTLCLYTKSYLMRATRSVPDRRVIGGTFGEVPLR